jgi:putative resolvase
MEDDYVTSTEAKKILKVSLKTLYRWCNDGKIRFITTPAKRKRFNRKDLYNFDGRSNAPVEKEKICYCRVSSSKQVDDLERQQAFFRDKFPTHQLVTDVGSGINWKRKGLRTILDKAMRGYISEIVVAHRDRLCRFAFELLEWIFEANDVKLVVLDEEKGNSTEQELADDILSIIHVYSCRKMGRRRYKNKKDKTISDTKTEESDEDVDGDEEICV